MSTLLPSDEVSEELSRAILKYKGSPRPRILVREGLLSLPSRRVLCGLDERFLQILDAMAVWGFENLFVPRVLLVLAHRRRRGTIAERGAHFLSLDGRIAAIQASPIFRLWPRKQLRDLAASATPWSFSRGEFLFYEREPSFALAVLLQGRAVVASTDSTAKVKGMQDVPEGTTYRYIKTLHAPVLIGEYAILAEELKQWVRAEEACDVLFIEVWLFWVGAF